MFALYSRSLPGAHRRDVRYTAKRKSRRPLLFYLSPSPRTQCPHALGGIEGFQVNMLKEDARRMKRFFFFPFPFLFPFLIFLPLSVLISDPHHP